MKSPPFVNGNGWFNPRNYVTPRRHAHRWTTDNGWFNAWHNDVRYYRSGECAPLLRADPDQTYLWSEPTIYFDSNHVRNYKKWTTINDLIELLRNTYELVCKPLRDAPSCEAESDRPHLADFVSSIAVRIAAAISENDKQYLPDAQLRSRAPL